MAAKFIVTSDPGTYVPGIGFVRPGEQYVAPPGHIPSRTALPANDEAVVELKKIQTELLAQAKELDAIAKDEKAEPEERRASKARSRVLTGLAGSIVLKPQVVPQEAPAIEKGLTLEQLEDIRAGQTPPGETSKQSRKL